MGVHRSVGPVMQNGYVVNDWRTAALHWAENLGVGPFFVMEHIAFDHCLYKGKPADIDMSVAIAYSGAHQIELVEQHNNTPSIYTDFLKLNEPGLQHVGALVNDLDRALDERNWRERRVQYGMTAAGQRFAYVDTEQHKGSMLELIEVNPEMENAFSYMRNVAENWDGKDPIRG